MVLSNLLSLELRWPSEKEETVNSDTNKEDPVSAPAVNLSGVDLDSYFSNSRNETASSAPTVSNDHLMPTEQDISIESSVSSGVQNLNLFENVQSLNIEITSTKTVEGDFDDSFADWKAEFQSASSETFPPEPKSINHIQGTFTAEFVSPVTSAATFSAEYKAVDLFHDCLTQTGRTSALNECASVMKSVDLQDTESGSSLPSDYFSGALDGPKGSIEVNNMQFDASISRNRINGTDEERVVSSTVQGAPMSDGYSNDSDLETSNSKIEKLLSDMPNLSFMLDSNLSIPKKVDGSYLNS